MIRALFLVVVALSAVQRSESPGVSQVRLTYLGTAGWEISDGRTTLLVDPYLSRLHMTSPNDDVLPGDRRRRFTPADAAESDTATIDRHIPVSYTHLTLPTNREV